MADSPNDGCEEKRQQQTEQRPGNCYDDFVERGNFRQPCPVHIRFSLDHVHWCKLRQRNEAAERQRAERVLDTVDCFLPDRFAEPNTESLDVKSSPARREKVPQFMYHDQQIEQDEDVQQDENDASDVKKHCEK